MTRNKILFAIMLIGFVSNSYSQQPTPAEIEKLMKEAQDMLKQYRGDSLVRDKLKKLQRNEGLFKKITTADPSIYASKKLTKFPARQTSLLASIPKKPLSATEAQKFASAL